MLKRSPLLILSVTTAAWGVATLIGASDGATSLFDFLSYFYGGAILGLVTLVLAVILLVRGIRLRTRLRHIFPPAFIAQCIVLLLVFLGVSFDLAFIARFEMSSRALTRAATDIQAGRRPARPGWVGLFQVSEVNVLGGAVRFITGDCLLDQCGLAFNSKTGEPPVDGEDFYSHLDGPWWYWHRSW